MSARCIAPLSKPHTLALIRAPGSGVNRLFLTEVCSMLSIYKTIMDSNRNPLRALLPQQRFQIMVVLSLMWTTIFCTMAGAWLWYG